MLHFNQQYIFDAVYCLKKILKHCFLISAVYFFEKRVCIYVCMYLFLGREGEKKGEKHQYVDAFHTPTTGDL